MIILSIETSCDDTCVALIEVLDKTKPRFKILSNIISSQVKIHEKWGGVYPLLAKREHQKNLPLVLKKVIKKAKNPKIDLMAITVGPGLDPCLWTGVNFAKDLAEKLNLKIVPVNHIEAHIFANWLNESKKYDKLFPAVCLVVSGGHTQLILMKDYGIYKILGETRDDAAGECFDKVAKILGLGYPGGPVIAKQAEKNKKQDLNLKINLPRPMIFQKNYDFSFSGLKTAVLYDFKSRSLKIRRSKEYVREMSAKTQQAIIDVLIHKTLKAGKNQKAKTIILGGGVASNQELRKQIKERIKKEMPKTKCLIPPVKFCTDNAAMVAVAAYYNLQKTKTQKRIEAKANLRIN
ncbi:tRNA (adenosine(37)-N6)-threonylcarbamoyltransferase complex transferase subunit TsaD [Patescibacteria group bacterium]